MGLEMPTEEWKQGRADFHLDPKKLDPVNHQELAEKSDILDQIRNADVETLKKIQENMAEAVTKDHSLINNSDFIEKLQAAYERSQKLNNVDDRTLH